MVKFHLTYGHHISLEQRVVFEVAARILSQFITDETTVDVHVLGASGLNDGTAVGGAVPLFHKVHYGVLKEYLEQDASSDIDDQSVLHLQNGNTVDLSAYGEVIDGNTEILLTRAQAEALGMDESLLLAGGASWDKDVVDAAGLDGYVVVNQDFAWNNDVLRLGEATEGALDTLSMAIHELAHVMGFVSGIDGTIRINELLSGELTVQGTTLFDLRRFTATSTEIENPDGSVSSITEGEAAYLSADGGRTSLGELSTGQNSGVGGDGYQASHWKRMQVAMGIMDPTLAYQERLSLSERDLQALDLLGWDIDYSQLYSELDIESLLLAAEQAVAESFGLDSHVLTEHRAAGNVYTMGFSEWWQLFENQIVEMGFSEWWQVLETGYDSWEQFQQNPDALLNMGFSEWWQAFEVSVLNMGFSEWWQTFESDMLNMGFSEWWQLLEMGFSEWWQQIDTYFSTFEEDGRFGDHIGSNTRDYSEAESSVVVSGGDADDILAGSQFRDLISGGGGDDLIDGEEGDDNLLGEAGNDIIYGFAGEDKLYGGDGDDFLAGEDDNDQLYGESGHDIVSGGFGDDLISGNDGHDMLKGDGGNDVISGDAGNDEIDGGDGQDLVIGGEGLDIVSGGSGDDTLYGDSYDNTENTAESDHDSLNDIAEQAGLITAESENILDFWVRLEAEDLKLKNFNIHEQSIASGNQLIATAGEGTASTKFSGPTGVYDIIVGYYDESDGDGELELSAGKGNQEIEVKWELNQQFGNNAVGTNNFVTKTIRNVTLESGSKIELEGEAENGEYVRVDYIDIVSANTSAKFDGSKFYNGSLYLQSQSSAYADRVAEAASLGGNMAVAESTAEQHWLTNTFGTTEGIIEIDARSSQFSVVLDEDSIEANETLRVEAEDFDLSSGYRVEQRRGAFSGGAVIEDVGNAKATTSFSGESGVYDIFVSYLDESSGNARARVKVNGQTLDDWRFNSNDGFTKYRSVGTQVSLNTGDTIELKGWSSGSEKARIDYVDFVSYVAPVENVTTAAEDTSSTTQVPLTDSGSATADSIMVATGNTIRVEAENMQLSGNASDLNDGFGSGDNFIKLDGENDHDSQASMLFRGESGYYNVVIGYFDVAGTAELKVRHNADVLDQWQLNQNLGGDEPSMRNFTTRTIATGIYLENNSETFRITGKKDNDDTGFVDYLQFIEVEPQAQQPPAPPVVIDTESESSSDILRGGQGNDMLYGGEGNDIIYGEDEFDSSMGAGNNDTLFGGSGDDALYGNSGDDVLYGDDESEASALVNGTVRNGSQYLLSQSGTWEAAQAEAESLSGNLVTVNNADEAAWLKDTFVTNQALWIGYTDKASEGQWEWISGEASDYTNWQPWQADGSGDYAAISDSNGRWDDQGGVEGWFNQGSDWSQNTENRGIIEIRLPQAEGGNDTLEGGRGNDTLKGGIGSDVLDGSNAVALGAYEYDILGGGLGEDTFVLGSTESSYYLSDGDSDYALIQDFDAAIDILQLYGSAGNYQTQQNGGSLRLESDGELIAILESTTELNLYGSGVVFV
ncbi:MAG: NF038122 family metalloprotease [Cyanobacteria bacterium J06650_10]